MPLEAKFQTHDGKGDIETYILPESRMFCYPDSLLGELTLAHSLANHEGAVVHRVDNFWEAVDDFDESDFFEMCTPATLQKELLPWMEYSTPVYSTNRHLVRLNLRHFPEITIHLQQPNIEGLH